MNLVELDLHNLSDINKANEPFEIIGTLRPSFINGKWEWEEELLEHSYFKEYPSEDCDYTTYIANPDKVVFLVYSGGECIGQVVLRKDWNKYAFIEDICVAKDARGKGVGTALIQRAVEWAKERELSGLALETQDTNLLACRFYAKCGFVIGGVNTMLYRNFEKPWFDESAIYWYLKF